MKVRNFSETALPAVRDAVLERIRSGKPGVLLPSEMDLHRELNVSLGTLRSKPSSSSCASLDGEHSCAAGRRPGP